MRKLMTLALMIATAAPVAMPIAANAQSRAEIRHDQRVLQRERRDVREARRELRQDRRERRAYVAPVRNWRYRTLTPGYRLSPVYYSSRYYITDVTPYRVRPAGRFQRWIRYGDDLVLVNTRNGRVIQVLRNRYYY